MFSQCCEQVLSGAGEGWGVFVHCTGKEKCLCCWMLAGSSCELPISHCWERHLQEVSWPNPHLASPWVSLFVTRCITVWWRHGVTQAKTSSAPATASLLVGKGGVRNVVCPLFAWLRVSCCWSFKSNACR